MFDTCSDIFKDMFTDVFADISNANKRLGSISEP